MYMQKMVSSSLGFEHVTAVSEHSGISNCEFNGWNIGRMSPNSCCWEILAIVVEPISYCRLYVCVSVSMHWLWGINIH